MPKYNIREITSSKSHRININPLTYNDKQVTTQESEQEVLAMKSHQYLKELGLLFAACRDP